MKINKSYIAPGHILQDASLWQEIKDIPPGKFLDAGCGIGLVSNFLLEQGWQGVGVDLNNEALHVNKQINKKYIKNLRYQCLNEDFTQFYASTINIDKFNLVISSNTIEHLEGSTFDAFLNNMKHHLGLNGTLVIIVPGSQQDWGIEDEVVGHVKRYGFEDMEVLGKQFNLKPEAIIGMTYPLSNILLGASNYLVRRNEGHKINKDNLKNTINSSIRKNQYKTEFPIWTKLIVNKYVLFPFIVLQRIFKYHPRSLAVCAKYSLHPD